MIKMIEKALQVGISLLGIAGILLFLLPQLAGCTPRIVISGSMEPEIPVGSIVYTSGKILQENIKKGDVIAYGLSREIPVLHRVVEADRNKREWVTKGDANETCDLCTVSYGQYLGKMIFHVPYAGYLAVMMQKKAVWFLLIFTWILTGVMQQMGHKKMEKERIV